ncbi:DUF6431 domain-containing protein [Breznakia blatticola]
MVTKIIEEIKTFTEEICIKRTLKTIYAICLCTIEIHHIVCPSCGVVGEFIFWGYYTRMFVWEDILEEIRIQRIFCKSCRVTHSILLSCMVPYSRFSLSIHIRIVQCKDDQELFDTWYTIGCISFDRVRNIRSQYFKHWKERLTVLKIVFDERLVFRVFKGYGRQFMQIHATINSLV